MRAYPWLTSIAMGVLVIVSGTGLMVLGDEKRDSGDPSVAGLVRQLGAGDFKQREKAEKQLAEMGADAYAELKKNADSDDPEINLRVKRLLGLARGGALKTLFVRKAKLKGYADEPQNLSNWPCVMEVKEYDEKTGAFKGEIEWTSLSALNVIEGTLTADKLVFKETKHIRAGNSVLGCIYTFDLQAEGNKSGNKVRGGWTDSAAERGGNVELTLEGQ